YAGERDGPQAARTDRCRVRRRGRHPRARPPWRSMMPKSGDRFPACAKPFDGTSIWLDASAGEGRSENIMLQKEPKGGCRFEEKASRFEVLIGLGGNVGDVRATLDRAVATLCDRDIRLLAQSSDYLTLPWGVEDQPAFVNRCIAVETTLPPRHLLER